MIYVLNLSVRVRCRLFYIIYILMYCRCGFKLGRYVEDGYVEVFENIYEEIKSNNPYNNINRCPYCGQLLDWKYKSRLEED